MGGQSCIKQNNINNKTHAQYDRHVSDMSSLQPIRKRRRAAAVGAPHVWKTQRARHESLHSKTCHTLSLTLSLGDTTACPHRKTRWSLDRAPSLEGLGLFVGVYLTANYFNGTRENYSNQLTLAFLQIKHIASHPPNTPAGYKKRRTSQIATGN